jgi:hypothetical protein
MDSYILPHGTVNLDTTTLKDKHFNGVNLIKDWDEADRVVELWQNVDTKAFKVIRGGSFISSAQAVANQNKSVWRHDQTNRKIGVYKIVAFTTTKNLKSFKDITNRTSVQIACYK